nr:C4 [Tomato yellow leaf curl virus]
MGNHISMCLSNLKANSSAKINDSSTWYLQAGQHISIQTFRELSAVQTSSLTWIRTETPSIGESFRSTDDQHEEVSSQPMTHTPQLSTQAVSQRLSESLKN